MESFGEYLRRLRLDKGFNQTQLAAQIGLDSGGLSKVETGKKELKEDKLSLISEIFDIDLDELKEQYFSEKFAKVCYNYKCPDSVFELAEQKVKYIKSLNIEQVELQFNEMKNG